MLDLCVYLPRRVRLRVVQQRPVAAEKPAISLWKLPGLLGGAYWHGPFVGSLRCDRKELQSAAPCPWRQMAATRHPGSCLMKMAISGTALVYAWACRMGI